MWRKYVWIYPLIHLVLCQNQFLRSLFASSNVTEDVGNHKKTFTQSNEFCH
jgi:hypothetical protein